MSILTQYQLKANTQKIKCPTNSSEWKFFFRKRKDSDNIDAISKLITFVKIDTFNFLFQNCEIVQ